MNRVSITHMNNKHNDWLRALDFYKDELGIMKGRLTEIAGKNTAPDTMKQIEHFENQIKVQINNVDGLSHSIRENIALAGVQAGENSAGYIDSKLLTQHDHLGVTFYAEEKIFNQIRQEFNQFAAAWM